jgi:hypothetical protein
MALSGEANMEKTYMYPHAERPGEIIGETPAGVGSPVDCSLRMILPEH